MVLLRRGGVLSEVLYQLSTKSSQRGHQFVEGLPLNSPISESGLEEIVSRPVFGIDLSRLAPSFPNVIRQLPHDFSRPGSRPPAHLKPVKRGFDGLNRGPGAPVAPGHHEGE